MFYYIQTETEKEQMRMCPLFKYYKYVIVFVVSDAYFFC